MSRREIDNRSWVVVRMKCSPYSSQEKNVFDLVIWPTVKHKRDTKAQTIRRVNFSGYQACSVFCIEHCGGELPSRSATTEHFAPFDLWSSGRVWYMRIFRLAVCFLNNSFDACPDVFTTKK